MPVSFFINRNILEKRSKDFHSKVVIQMFKCVRVNINNKCFNL